MIGNLCGDILGSRFEFHNNLPPDCAFLKDSVYTDDTVLSLATADTLLNGGSYAKNYLEYAQAYPNRGYGGSFDKMVKLGRLEPYNSYGNGSCMRISPVGWVFDDINETAREAKKSAECTHNHREGIKGAIAVACSIWMARKGHDKKDIKSLLEKDPLNYDLSREIKDFDHKFDVTCQGTIPRCMAIFFETNSFEEAMLEGIKMGGDVDTNCCIVGGICDAIYGLPKREIIEAVYERIPKQMANIVTTFTKKYIDKNFIEPEKIATKASSMEDALSSLFS
jgi:ADP-ribosylglycohydrolase